MGVVYKVCTVGLNAPSPSRSFIQISRSPKTPCSLPSRGGGVRPAVASQHRRRLRCQPGRRRPLPGNGVCRGDRSVSSGEKRGPAVGRTRRSTTSAGRPRASSMPTRAGVVHRDISRPTCCSTTRAPSRFSTWAWCASSIPPRPTMTTRVRPAYPDRRDAGLVDYMAPEQAIDTKR